jgi:Uma2 family endonuclease
MGVSAAPISVRIRTMAAVAEKPQVLAPAGDRFLLTGISWETYERLLEDLDRSGRRFKLTYDLGDLEIEMPLELHEILKCIVSQLLEMYLIEAGVPFMPTGATTWKRRIKEKGLEADESYYIQNVKIAESAEAVDLEREPPPDLAIESEVTKPLLPKLPVYAGLGVREIWHAKGDLTVDFLKLNEAGEYIPVDGSIAVPFFTPSMLADWIRRRMNTSHYATLQQFRSEVLAKIR